MTGTITVATASTIREVLNEADITIYPNPSAGHFEITAIKPIERVQIFDITGKMILDREINSDNASFDLGNEAKGVYLVRLHANGIITTKRIILAK